MEQACSVDCHGSFSAGLGCAIPGSRVAEVMMLAKGTIWKQTVSQEFLTVEGCYILETYNQTADDSMSIARARVSTGITTAWHSLNGTIERYIIAEGSGRVEVGDLPPSDVASGDVVIIPAGVRQRIANIGKGDLIFYCICTPRFQPAVYRSLE